jgi:hypothetical protein
MEENNQIPSIDAKSGVLFRICNGLSFGAITDRIDDGS